MIQKSEFAKWVTGIHSSTNHLYDDYLPYEYHLRMAVSVAYEFDFIMGECIELGIQNNYQTGDAHPMSDFAVINAIWAHDVMEDRGVSYNDIRSRSCRFTAEIALALKDRWGRNRKERKPPEAYEFMRSVPCAPFGKLCDRIANIQHGYTFANADMLQMYSDEQYSFGRELYIPVLQPMFNKIDTIFDNAKTRGFIR